MDLNKYTPFFIIAIIVLGLILLTVGITIVGNFGIALIIDGIIALLIGLIYTVVKYD